MEIGSLEGPKMFPGWKMPKNRRETARNGGRGKGISLVIPKRLFAGLPSVLLISFSHI